MTVTIRIGDCRALLKAMPDESVDEVVTSPPYWGLRDYGVASQIGMERSLGEHIDVLVDVFREIRRVLKRSGTVWLNYGDCYATSPNGRSAADTKALAEDDRTFRDKPFSTIGAIYVAGYERTMRAGVAQNGGNLGAQHGGRIVGVSGGGYLKPKDLCMLPNRLAIALQDDGWFVRSEIVWHKPNPMPESIADRPGCTHEKVWLLTKSGETTLWHHAKTGAWTAEEPSPDYRWRDRSSKDVVAEEPHDWRTELLADGKTKRWYRFNLWEGFDYFYDADAVAEPVTQSTLERVSQPTWEEQKGSDRHPARQTGQ